MTRKEFNKMFDTMMKNAYRFLLLGLVLVAGSIYVNRAEADYTLVMVMFQEHRLQFGHEPFIAYSDCRSRGLKNLDLLDTYKGFNGYNIEVGFYCEEMKDDG